MDTQTKLDTADKILSRKNGVCVATQLIIAGLAWKVSESWIPMALCTVVGITYMVMNHLEKRLNNTDNPIS